MYFEQFSFALSGDLDVGALERAWQAVVDRHAVLRTSSTGRSWRSRCRWSTRR